MISIIIVHYLVPKEIIQSIQSIVSSKSKTAYEIIVIDNDEKETIRKQLLKKFPQVTYIKNTGNVGFGAANNIGAKRAKGEYLFFLNPDTVVYPHALDNLISFLKEKKDTGIVAPLLLDSNEKPYTQGTLELTPLRGIFSLSFISKLLPSNRIKKNYYLHNWDKKSIKEADVSPGTAMFMKKNLFEKVGGFDEKFFLYFEEFDFCKRVRALGYKIYIIPTAKVKHLWGVSTKQNKNIESIFNKSRFYYFKKHYGLLVAGIVELFVRINKYTITVFLSLVLGLFICLYRLNELMPFIGDFGWFYMSAKDIVTSGAIPLVGIASSHPWLHQGALWTYILAPVLWIFYFNPICGAFVSIGFYLATILLLYRFGSEMFSKRAGAIAAFLYATSPLIITHARSPYHTSPIPLFALIYFYAMYKWVKGNSYFFPICIFILAILYNLEIATFLLTIVFVLVCCFGMLKKKVWFKNVLNKKIVLFSVAALIIPMVPMLIYDFNNGFPQTVLSIAWIGYKILVSFGYPALNEGAQSTDVTSVIGFLAANYQKLVYVSSEMVAFTIGFFSIGLLFGKMYFQMRIKKYDHTSILLVLVLVICLIGIIVTKTISDAYLPVLFPIMIFITALFFDYLLKTRKTSRYYIIATIALIGFVNIFSLINQQYLIGKPSTISAKIAIAEKIVSEAEGRRYNLIGKGSGSQFESFTMPYEYLTWWLGHAPSKNKEYVRFTISENENGIILKKEIKNSNL